jgi:ankyrin repeat protein
VLHIAAHNKHEVIVWLLLEHKADLNAKGRGRQTEHGADIDTKTSYGFTALFGAAYMGHEAVVRLLLEH